MKALFPLCFVYDIEQNSPIYIHQSPPFDFLEIKSLQDLELFWEKIFGKKAIPLFELIEKDKKLYIAKRKWIEKYLIYTLEEESMLLAILEQIENEAMRDGLTGCYNKKSIENFLEKLLQNYIRYRDQPLSIVLFDIDFFKKVNDTYGHLAGDFILKEVAALTKKELRKSDLCGRFGGEEFLIILPHTKAPGALRFAERLREKIQNHSFIYQGRKIPITISLGVTTAGPTDSVISLIDRADQALYQAKTRGRNRVEYL